MALQTDLMGTGMPWPQADKVGYNPQTVAAAGTTQTNAATTTSKLIEMTATGSDGIILGNVDQGTPCFVYNSSGSNGTVYVPVGHTLNNSLNGSLVVASHKMAMFVQYKNKFWGSILSA
jgi:hypothetical protein